MKDFKKYRFYSYKVRKFQLSELWELSWIRIDGQIWYRKDCSSAEQGAFQNFLVSWLHYILKKEILI